MEPTVESRALPSFHVLAAADDLAVSTLLFRLFSVFDVVVAVADGQDDEQASQGPGHDSCGGVRVRLEDILRLDDCVSRQANAGTSLTGRIDKTKKLCSFTNTLDKRDS